MATPRLIQMKSTNLGAWKSLDIGDEDDLVLSMTKLIKAEVEKINRTEFHKRHVDLLLRLMIRSKMEDPEGWF
jgi:hypothetical protein